MAQRKTVTVQQKKKIYAVAREIGLDNDLLHDLVEIKFKKQHISDLTLAQAGSFIDYLEGRKGTADRYTQLPTGRQLALITDKQLWKMNQLAKELGWQDNPKRLQGFCRKYAQVDNPEWLTKEQAWRVIEGLKSLAKQAHMKGGGMDGKPADAALDGGD